ncbi:unnamed protein product [Caenorhabditis bovis]|uniref:BZIP domain-containing protein n=1 Tax=Caenorhabditis bovis TaxID=2654633 RepID=A0A8S1F5D9_9PELO|nr:unnamed protein product [Caenorhabditis bovis]
MDLHRALSALIGPMGGVPNQSLAHLGFPFPDTSSLLTAALTSKLESPLGIVPYESAAVPTSTTQFTPTKKAKIEEPSSPVSSHSSTVSSTNFSSPAPSPCRKPAHPIPVEKKDEAYFERRRKNNDAAKRSRDARRQKEEAVAAKAAALEQENIQLRGQIAVLQQETAKLQLMLFSTASRVVKDSKKDSTIEV